MEKESTKQIIKISQKSPSNNDDLRCIRAILFVIQFGYPFSLVSKLDESISYCEYLIECESMSRMQESLCLGNNNYKMPFWLPSSNKTAHRCYLALRNDYILQKDKKDKTMSQIGILFHDKS
ncbi:unnamed protein product [Dracunculus medinensis]|uniref:Uncharacterized protein n=1 Tax=Dracunculus medinensis TaxID=318479 RepID=A0A0N4UPW8_DRAME|nr:unnamed protein product [Dracunculus medinensis]